MRRADLRQTLWGGVISESCLRSLEPRARSQKMLSNFPFFHTVFDVKISVKFSVAHPNPGKRSRENFTKISRRFWQRKTKKNFTSALLQGRELSEFLTALVAPLNRLNAIPSLLQPLDSYRTRSAIGNAIGRALSRPVAHPRAGGSSQPPRSKPLRGLNRAMVVLECLKPL